MAPATPKAVPTINARIELYRVPQISGRMPNWPVLGSQVVPVMNPKPYWRIAGTPARMIFTTMKAMLMTVNQAKPWQRRRKVLSVNNCSREGGWEIEVTSGTMDGSSQLKPRRRGGRRRGGIPPCAGPREGANRRRAGSYWMLWIAAFPFSTTGAGRGI